MNTPMTREQLKSLLNETAEERKRLAAENKVRKEKEAAIKKAAKEQGLSLTDRKPARSEVVATVLNSPFLNSPKTVEEIDVEANRIGIKEGLKDNVGETKLVRVHVVNALTVIGFLKLENGKINRVASKAVKAS